MLTRRKLEALEKWFLEYVGKFEENEQIADAVMLKKNHCLRVRDNMIAIARSESLGESAIAMAEVIGLLHDIGRFLQYSRFETFADHRSINHGAFGVEVLQKEGVLDEVAEEDKEIVFFAVGHHNGASLPDTVNDEASLFGKMIRDADKLDILEIVIDQYRKVKTGEHIKSVMLELDDNDSVSEEVLMDLRKREIIKKEHLRTVSDFKLLQIGWVFDMHFKHTFVMLRQKGFLDDIFAEIPNKTSDIEKIFEDIKIYLNQKCDCV